MEADGRLAVLHVISGLGLGGAEKMLLWSARCHDRKLFRMGVVSLMAGGELSDQIRREGVDVYEIGLGKGQLTLSAFRKFMGIIAEFRPRILQGHMHHSNLLVRAAGLWKGKTVVISTRHIDLAPWGRRVLNGATGFLSDATLVFSSRVLEEEKRENLFRRPLRLIRYGVPLPERVQGGADPERRRAREEAGVPPEAFVWLAVGRLTKQKGFTHLLDAFSRMPDTAARSFLIIAGDGEDRAALEKHAGDWGLGDRVVFAGPVRDAGPLMEAADAFVLSSLWEGGPLVILEAMAAGLPVVSTRVGDAPSMVVEGKTGILIDPGDPFQMAQAMSRVQDMGPGAAQWGRRGRRRVEELFDFSRLQRETEAFYMELAGRPSPVG